MFKTMTYVMVTALAVGGCATPQSTARDADNAQHDADETTARANEKAKLEGDAIRQRGNEENARNAQDAMKTGERAQGDADRKAAEATDSLAKARIEARDESERKLAGLEKQFAELKPKLVKKLSRADSTTIVSDLTARSEAVRVSIGDLASATADSLEPIKSTVAQRLVDFDTALAEARKRV